MWFHCKREQSRCFTAEEACAIWSGAGLRCAHAGWRVVMRKCEGFSCASHFHLEHVFVLRSDLLATNLYKVQISAAASGFGKIDYNEETNNMMMKLW